MCLSHARDALERNERFFARHAHNWNDFRPSGSPQGVNTNGAGGGGVGSRQTPPPGLHACSTNTPNGNLTQSMQLNHRSIFQTDNNSFFSSNSFQKVSTIVTMPSNSQTGKSFISFLSSNLFSKFVGPLDFVAAIQQILARQQKLNDEKTRSSYRKFQTKNSAN